MNKEEMIEKIKDILSDNTNIKSSEDMNYYDAIDESQFHFIADDIIGCFADVVSSWVSIKYKKPRKNQEVLFKSSSGQLLYGYYDKDKNEAYINGKGSWLLDITHWMNPKKHNF